MAGRWLAAVAALAAAPLASADTLENLHGNTLQVSYPSGQIERFYIDADGTFSMSINGEMLAGTLPWTREGDQFCVVVEGQEPQCSDFPADKAVGDAWEVERPDGTVAQYEIVAGREAGD